MAAGIEACRSLLGEPHLPTVASFRPRHDMKLSTMRRWLRGGAPYDDSQFAKN